MHFWSYANLCGLLVLKIYLSCAIISQQQYQAFGQRGWADESRLTLSIKRQRFVVVCVCVCVRAYVCVCVFACVCCIQCRAFMYYATHVCYGMRHVLYAGTSTNMTVSCSPNRLSHTRQHIVHTTLMLVCTPLSKNTANARIVYFRRKTSILNTGQTIRYEWRFACFPFCYRQTRSALTFPATVQTTRPPSIDRRRRVHRTSSALTWRKVSITTFFIPLIICALNCSIIIVCISSTHYSHEPSSLTKLFPIAGQLVSGSYSCLHCILINGQHQIIPIETHKPNTVITHASRRTNRHEQKSRRVECLVSICTYMIKKMW